MLQKGSRMSLLWALVFVWLICGCATPSECAMDANAAPRKDCHYRKTCMGITYDIHEAVCCENQLHPGAGLSCCGKMSFNPAVATCCKGHGNTSNAKITLHLSEKVSDCCGLEAYNPLNEICCESTIKIKPAPKAQCCGKETFDVDKQLCCGPIHNKTILSRNSSHHQCCGHDQFDTMTHCCCGNEDLQIQPRTSKCCAEDSEAFDVDKKLHCGPVHNKTTLLRNSSHHQCCGYDQFDTRTHCCCGNEDLQIQPRTSKCCAEDSEAFDVDKKLHCGPVHNKTTLLRNSSHHQCCGYDQFDTRTHCCCGNEDLQIQPRTSKCCAEDSEAFNVDKKLHCGPVHNKTTLLRNSSHHQCCGYDQFDTRTHCCCGNEDLQIQPRTSKCCAEDSEAFNVDKKLHCGPVHNKTTLLRNSSHHQCCGYDQFDTRTHCCCGNEDLQIQPRTSKCCAEDSEAFDVDKKLHCGPVHNKTTLLRNSSHHQCCGYDQFDTRTHCCCGNEDLQIQPRTSKCCAEDSEAFDVDKKLHCGPVHNKTTLLRNSSHHQCCGYDQFDTRTHCCCANEDLQIQPRTSKCCAEDSDVHQRTPPTQPNCTEPHARLCGSTWYNPNDFQCCERHQAKPHWCCIPGQCDVTPKVYNPHTHVCCDGCVSERKPWTDQCCGQTPYGLAQRRVLCCKNTLYKDREDGEECSENSIPYDPAKGTICCSQFHALPGQHCCGTEIYRPHTEICCKGHRHPKAENSLCCGIHVYNSKDPQMKCCGGALYNLTSLGKHWQGSQCCGSVLQKNKDVCCSSEHNQLLYSEKDGHSCCGHLYYNTSLWSCCAGKLSPVHQPGQNQDRIKECRLLSVNNLKETDLCNEIKVGTVDSVSLHSIVFVNVFKVHGINGTMEPLLFPYVLETPDRCSSPKLIPGKIYFFNDVNVFTDFNHESALQSLHFLIYKCYHP